MPDSYLVHAIVPAFSRARHPSRASALYVTLGSKVIAREVRRVSRCAFHGAANSEHLPSLRPDRGVPRRVAGGGGRGSGGAARRERGGEVAPAVDRCRV